MPFAAYFASLFLIQQFPCGLGVNKILDAASLCYNKTLFTTCLSLGKSLSQYSLSLSLYVCIYAQMCIQ